MSPQGGDREWVGGFAQGKEMIPNVRGERRDRRQWVPGRQSWLERLCHKSFVECVCVSGGARWWR